MKKRPLLLIVVFVIGFAAGVLVWHRVVVKWLADENVALQNQLKEVFAAAEADAASGKEQITAEELKRLRDGQAELLRLRGQVSNLRRDAEAARNAAQKALASAVMNGAAASVLTNQSPVESFTAAATATVGWKGMLVTGGWPLPGGKRGFVFVQPNDGVGDNQVEIVTHVFEGPEDQLVALGQSVRSETDDPDRKGILSAEVASELLQKLKDMEGVSFMSTPRVTTLSGQQAQVQVTEAHTAPNGETYYTGPTIDIVPIIGADGKSVQMAVVVQLNLKRPTTP